MTRVIVFMDYQNIYHGARDTFRMRHDHPIKGHVRPIRFGALLKQLGEEVDPERELTQVRVYRGEPTAKSHAKLQGSFQRQVEGWRSKAPRLTVTTRPLRYNPIAWDKHGVAYQWDMGEERRRALTFSSRWTWPSARSATSST